VKGLAVRKTIVASLILAPSLALASGYSLPNTNPRDLGLCASSVAAQRDSGAAFALPAALSRLDGPSVRLAGGGVNVFNTWQDPAGVAPDTDMSNAIALIGNVSIAYGGKLAMLGDRGWGVGFGIQPFGGAIVEWPEDWTGRYRITDVDRRSLSGTLTAGIELIPQVRLGGGLLYYYTMQEFKQQFCTSCVLPVPDATATLDLSGGALSYDVSAEIDPIPNVPLRIGIDYKHKATQELDGDVTWEGLPPGASALNPLLQNQDVEQTLTIPNLLNIGLAYRVIQPLLVTFTFTFDRWLVYDSDTFVGSLAPDPLVVERRYRNGQTYRAGAEYDLTPAIQLRAGLQRDVSGLRTSTYSPTLPDGSSWAGSLGATYKFARGFSLDAALFYATMDDVTSTDVGAEPSAGNPLTSGTLRGTYSPSALVYGLALGWQPNAAR
jgi:long-chain fatty acid transport protein